MAQVTPGTIRAQVIFQGRSGIPEDRFVNTFHFTTTAVGIIDVIAGDAMGPYAANIGERLREFYIEPVSGGGSVFHYLSGLIERRFEIRCYDLGQPSPPAREAWTNVYELPPAIDSPPLPSEVAVCASYYADRNIPRRRGRFYLGPLSTQAMTTANNTSVVNEGCRSTIAQACERLSAEGVGDQTNWVLHSPTDNESHEVNGGWVDDAFDTMRKRGIAPLVRTQWPAVD